jgi:thiamine-phosphate pyrophosphorylase
MELSKALSLYFIPDKEIGLGRDEIFQTIEAIKGGATAIQLRVKKRVDLEFYQIGLEMRRITKENNVLFIVNDRLDIAMAINADGVHLGKEDLPISVVKKLVSEDFIIGASVSNEEEAIKAQREGAGYLAVSSIFPTTSKNNVEVVGIETLAKIVEITSLPVIGIGGINLENVEQVLLAGACGVSVISAIASKDDILKATFEFKKKIIQFLKEGSIK